tara:strand:+ start:24208 stop:24420 length:213 start_codon:yes stop_codon:yes gene_type:complete
MFEVKVGIEIGKEYFEAGSLVPENKIPKKSKKWLLDQGIIAKGFDKKEFVKEELKKDLKVDDYDTEFEEE